MGRFTFPWLFFLLSVILAHAEQVTQHKKVHEEEAIGAPKSLGDLPEGVDACSLFVCRNDGECLTDPTHPSGFLCICPLGFHGQKCEHSYTECSPNPCHHKGECVATPHGYKCLCKPKYSGETCQEVNKSELKKPVHQARPPVETNNVDVIIGVACGLAAFLILIGAFCGCVFAERRELLKRHESAIELGLKKDIPGMDLLSLMMRVIHKYVGCLNPAKPDEAQHSLLVEEQGSKKGSVATLLSEETLKRIQEQKAFYLTKQSPSASTQSSKTSASNTRRSSDIDTYQKNISRRATVHGYKHSLKKVSTDRRRSSPGPFRRSHSEFDRYPGSPDRQNQETNTFNSYKKYNEQEEEAPLYTPDDWNAIAVKLKQRMENRRRSSIMVPAIGVDERQNQTLIGELKDWKDSDHHLHHRPNQKNEAVNTEMKQPYENNPDTHAPADIHCTEHEHPQSNGTTECNMSYSALSPSRLRNAAEPRLEDFSLPPQSRMFLDQSPSAQYHTVSPVKSSI